MKVWVQACVCVRVWVQAWVCVCVCVCASAWACEGVQFYSWFAARCVSSKRLLSPFENEKSASQLSRDFLTSLHFWNWILFSIQWCRDKVPGNGRSTSNYLMLASFFRITFKVRISTSGFNFPSWASLVPPSTTTSSLLEDKGCNLKYWITVQGCPTLTQCHSLLRP